METGWTEQKKWTGFCGKRTVSCFPPNLVGKGNAASDYIVFYMTSRLQPWTEFSCCRATQPGIKELRVATAAAAKIPGFHKDSLSLLWILCFPGEKVLYPHQDSVSLPGDPVTEFLSWIPLLNCKIIGYTQIGLEISSNNTLVCTKGYQQQSRSSPSCLL